LPGTEGAYYPFFSPDGNWVGFFAHDELKKVALSGGDPILLCKAIGPWGATWSDGDHIFFSILNGRALHRVSAAGGDPEAILTPESLIWARWPFILPDGRALLFSDDLHNLHVISLEDGEPRHLLPNVGAMRYLPTGHLVYAQSGRLMAVQFDAEKLEVIGVPVPVLDDLRTESFARAAQYSVSEDGTLYYVSGGPADVGRFAWVDREGEVIEIIEQLPSAPYSFFCLSPDDRYLAYDYSPSSVIGIYDFQRQVASTLVTESNNRCPTWSQDSTKVAFASNRNGTYDIFMESIGGGEAKLLRSDPKSRLLPRDISTECTPLAFTAFPGGWGELPIDDDGEPGKVEMYLGGFHWFSPDGRYFCYLSTNEENQWEVYVKEFPPTERVWKISSDLGVDPTWSPDGMEIYYLDRTFRNMMVVPISYEPEFDPGTPRILFEGDYLDTMMTSHDVSRDGRFLMLVAENPERTAGEIKVVHNWFEELKRLCPPN
jgi:serine/threonine-protein kinase